MSPVVLKFLSKIRNEAAGYVQLDESCLTADVRISDVCAKFELHDHINYIVLMNL
jgi:hypothetical protein